MMSEEVVPGYGRSLGDRMRDSHLIARLKKEIAWGGTLAVEVVDKLVVRKNEVRRLEAERDRLREAIRQAMDDTPGWYDLARAALAPHRTPHDAR